VSFTQLDAIFAHLPRKNTQTAQLLRNWVRKLLTAAAKLRALRKNYSLGRNGE
jgi:hypothetical protein